MSNLQTVVDQILDARDSIPSHRSVLTAIPGIDGCGKGYIAARIVNAVQAKGVRATGINIDGRRLIAFILHQHSHPSTPTRLTPLPYR